MESLNRPYLLPTRGGICRRIVFNVASPSMGNTPHSGFGLADKVEPTASDPKFGKLMGLEINMLEFSWITDRPAVICVWHH